MTLTCSRCQCVPANMLSYWIGYAISAHFVMRSIALLGEKIDKWV